MYKPIVCITLERHKVDPSVGRSMRKPRRKYGFLKVKSGTSEKKPDENRGINITTCKYDIRDRKQHAVLADSSN